MNCSFLHLLLKKAQGKGWAPPPQLCFYFYFASSSYVFLLSAAWNQLSPFPFLRGPSTCPCFSSLSQGRCKQHVFVPRWVFSHLILFGPRAPRCQLMWQSVHSCQGGRPQGAREGLPEKLTLSDGQKERASSAGQVGDE